MLQLAGHLLGATPESGQTYFDGDTPMQTYLPDTDSNIASSSVAPAGFDASAGASNRGFVPPHVFSTPQHSCRHGMAVGTLSVLQQLPMTC